MIITQAVWSCYGDTVNVSMSFCHFVNLSFEVAIKLTATYAETVSPTVLVNLNFLH